MTAVFACVVFGASIGLALASRADRSPGWYRERSALPWLGQILLVATIITAAASTAFWVIASGQLDQAFG